MPVEWFVHCITADERLVDRTGDVGVGNGDRQIMPDLPWYPELHLGLDPPLAVDEFVERGALFHGADAQNKVVTDIAQAEGQTARLIDLPSEDLYIERDRPVTAYAYLGNG